VIHLLHTTGYTARTGEELVRDELTGRALDLARMLRRLLPAEREAAGLLALLLIHEARRMTRTDSTYLPSTKADLLHRLGRDAEAAAAYQAALALTDNATERAFLEQRLGAEEP